MRCTLTAHHPLIQDAMDNICWDLHVSREHCSDTHIFEKVLELSCFTNTEIYALRSVEQLACSYHEILQ
eukprot:5342355-Alexandrium_andersonii.AAC.1